MSASMHAQVQKMKPLVLSLAPPTTFSVAPALPLPFLIFTGYDWEARSPEESWYIFIFFLL